MRQCYCVICLTSSSTKKLDTALGVIARARTTRAANFDVLQMLTCYERIVSESKVEAFLVGSRVRLKVACYAAVSAGEKNFSSTNTVTGVAETVIAVQ